MEVDISNRKAVEEAVTGGIGALVPVSQQPLTPTVFGSQKAFEGRINYPYLNTAFAVGRLGEAGYTPGQLVLSGGDENVILYTPISQVNKNQSNPVSTIILNYAQYWKEYAFREGEAAKVFASREEAHTAGFTTEWDNAAGRPASAPPAMRWLLLLARPEGVESGFFCVPSADGRMWAPAYMNVERTAYREVSTTFGLTERATRASGRGLHSVLWDLTTRLWKSKSNTNSTWVPKLTKIKDLTDEEITNLVGKMS